MRRIIILLVAAIIASITLSSCGSELPSQSLPPDDGIVSKAISDLDIIPAEYLLEDYTEFWDQFNDNYIFIPILEEMGIDLSTIEKKYRDRIEAEELNIKNYYELLDNMLREMYYFAHLQMVTPSWSKYYIDSEYDYLLNPTPKSLDTSRLTYRKLEETMPNKISGYKDSISPQVNLYYDSKTVYIKYITFAYDEGDKDRELLSETLSNAFDRMGGINNLIFDIRGNGGGNTEYWRGSIVGPLGGCDGWENEIFIKKVPLLTDVFEDDYFESEFESEFTISKGSKYKPISEYPKEESLPRFVEQLGLDYYSEIEETIKDTSEGIIDVNGIKKYVLVDNYVYSAADNFAAFCKDTGWATLIGKPTKGDGMGGMPMGLILNNTGLIVRFSISASPNDNGELNTEKGTNPDIYTLREDALTKCLAIINSDE